MADSRLSETQKILVTIPAFSGLAPDDLKAIHEYMQRESYPAGGVIFTEGEKGDKLYLVKSGMVDIVKKAVDEFSGTVPLAHRGPGEIIGEMSVIDDAPRFATAVCARPTDLSSLSRENFMRLVQSRPDLALHILKLMIARVKETDTVRLVELEEKNTKLETSAGQLHKALKELKSSNRQLGEALRFRQRLLDVSPYPVMVTNAEMILTYCNPEALSVFGVEPSTSTGHHIGGFLECWADEKSDEIARTLQESGRWGGEVEVHTSDGQCVFCRVAAAPVPFDDGPANTFLFIFHDETEIRFLQKQATERERLASKGEMAAEIAHEMNNYLAVLSGNVELLPMFLKSGNTDRTDKCLKTLEKSLARMQVFAQAMLSSRPPKQEKVREDFNRFVENQIAFLKPQRKFKKIVLVVKLDKGLPSFEYDPNAMQQVLYNLILNSVEALASTPNPEPTVTVTTKWVRKSGGAVLEVSDNGPGINPGIAGQMFQRRVTTKPLGHGIGLMTVKKIVDEHGGSITAGTTTGGGAIFTLQLPVQVEAADSTTARISIPTNR